MSYTNRRNIIALGLLTALAALGSGKGGGAFSPARPRVKSPRPEHTRNYARASGHLPHQGTRERIRRIGGEQWAMYKRADRVFRGLPAERT